MDAGSLWQLEQDLPSDPSAVFQASSACSTKIMPGLSKSSACMARVSVPRNSQPDITSSTTSAIWAGAAVRVTIVISSFKISVSSTGSAQSGVLAITLASKALVSFFIVVPPKTNRSANGDHLAFLVD